VHRCGPGNGPRQTRHPSQTGADAGLIGRKLNMVSNGPLIAGGYQAAAHLTLLFFSPTYPSVRLEPSFRPGLHECWGVARSGGQGRRGMRRPTGLALMAASTAAH